jgi:hypothetical protein
LVFLGAFVKLGKATISAFVSVRPSSWNNSAPTGRVFVKIDTLVFFENVSIIFSFIKIGLGKRVLYVKTYVYFGKYLDKFFLE